MKTRCYNKNFKQYADYGGRGIRVCDRWLHDSQKFLKDMGKKPEGTTLDRIDNDGDYTPANCRWADRTVQALNSRAKSTSKSGVKGVHIHQGKWYVDIMYHGVRHYVGYFETLEEASKARQHAEVVLLQGTK